MAELLIDAGANVGFVSKTGLRIIEYGILGGFYEITQLIFKRLSRE